MSHDVSTGPERERPSPKAGRRGRMTAYLLVAIVSLAIGAGGTFLLIRTRRAAPTSAPTLSTEAGKQAGGDAGMPGMEGMPAKEPAIEAPNKAVYISPARQQLIGVRTAIVGHQVMDATIRTVGTLAYDETRVSQIHTRFAGWVERVFVDYVGKAVRRDQPLFTIYSPELVSTQNEYLLALKASSQLQTSQVETTRTAVESLRSAALDRLRLWNIPEEQVKELERTGKVQKALTLDSPFDGVILERNVFPGQYVTPEMSTFKIANLSNIWAFGAVFEYELPLLNLGQEAEIEFPYGPATRTLKGRITFIYPEVDPQTRRVKIRTEFPNPGFQFKPETYVTVVIRTGGGHTLAIPKEAVIDTGAKRYAIVSLPNGYFEPRDVQVGEPSDEFYPLLGGLKEGDQVVTSAQFLIDSETNLQAAMQSMIGMPGMETKGEGSEVKSGGNDMKGMTMPGEALQTPQPPPSSGHEKH